MKTIFIRFKNWKLQKRFFTLSAVFLIIFTLNAQTQIGNDIDGDSLDELSGSSIHMPDANTLAVGSPNDNVNGWHSGKVKVYSWNGSKWIQKGSTVFGKSDTGELGKFVFMPNSNTLAIGSVENDSKDPSYAGKVQVYSWDGTNWQKKGSAFNGSNIFASFNNFCMPDANTIAIYSYMYGYCTGLVKVYVWDGLKWVKKGADFSGSESWDYFGTSVSMPNSNTIAIGIVGQIATNGSAKIYTWQDSVWVQKGTDIVGEASDDWFGWSVSMPTSNFIAIGAPYNDGNGNNSGHARVYKWNGSKWQQQGNDIDGLTIEGEFGRTLAMADSNHLAIGSYAISENGNNAGQVRIFEWDGATWVQIENKINGEAADDFSASSISMPDATTIGIGAPYNDGNGSNTGHVRVFKLNAKSNSKQINKQTNLIYPNPTKTIININVELFSQNLTYSIYDVFGKIVMSGKMDYKKPIIKVNNLKQGIYNLVIMDETNPNYKLFQKLEIIE